MSDGIDPALEIRGLSGPLLGRSWTISPGRPLVFGRTVKPTPEIAAVVIPDIRISSEHCRIEHTEDAFRVLDLDSRNGVRVNGKRIPRGGAENLRHGDIISLAEVALEVRLCERSDPGIFHLGSNLEDTQSDTRTATSWGKSHVTSSLVPDLLPFPVAMGIRKVRHAIGSLDRVHEAIHSFEAILRFQTLVALSEYLALGKPDDIVSQLLTAFSQRPFSLGRWLELHTALARAIAGDPDLVVPELATSADGEDGMKRWRGAASRMVELRNSLMHGNGINAASTEIVGPQVTEVFNEVLSCLAYWVGYKFIAVEPGAWDDEASVFNYPCRLLMDCATPFEARSLRSADALPPRVPILISRDAKRRLSLAPLQRILPAEDKQLHWFWLAEATPQRATFLTYPASFRITLPTSGTIRELLSGERTSANTRASFTGKVPER